MLQSWTRIDLKMQSCQGQRARPLQSLAAGKAGKVSAASAASCSSDTAAGDVCLIITNLDKLVVQLQRHVCEMQTYCSDAAHNNAVQLTTSIQPKIAQVQDVCSYIQIKADHLVMQQEDSLMKRATKLRCQLLLATCAVFAQKLLHKGSYTSGYRQHCFHTLITELLHTGPTAVELGFEVAAALTYCSQADKLQPG